MFNNLVDDTIYIPSNYDYRGINDQVAYGKIDVMKKYNSINALDLLNKSLAIANPETLTIANIKFYNLKIERVNINYYLDK